MHRIYDGTDWVEIDLPAMQSELAVLKQRVAELEAQQSLRVLCHLFGSRHEEHYAGECPHCGRERLLCNGHRIICEKCRWDVEAVCFEP
jgi:hypothetical protein